MCEKYAIFANLKKNYKMVFIISKTNSAESMPIFGKKWSRDHVLTWDYMSDLN
jgi:hypothetical protein